MVTFILEREFKFAVVAKERLQCFKLIAAYLRRHSSIFPMLFAQSILAVANNVEETQLRRDSIELMIEICSKAPKIAAQVGIIRQLIECMQDVTLE